MHTPYFLFDSILPSDSFKCVTFSIFVLLLMVMCVMTLKRFGVSVPEDLLEKFDKLVEKRKYVGRSEAIRDAMREYLSQAEWESEAEYGNIIASLNIVYQHKAKLMTDLMRIQHEEHAQVVSTVHIHATHDRCLEVITLKGNRKSIEAFANTVSGLKGIEYVKLFTFFLPDDEDSNHGHIH